MRQRGGERWLATRGWIAMCALLAACGGGGSEMADSGSGDGGVDARVDAGPADGGPPEEPFFVSADPAYVAMREALHRHSPGNVLEPSRRTGFPLGARSGPVSFGDGTPGRRLPLQPSSGTSRYQRGETLFQFLARHADSLGLTLPREELQLPDDIDNPELEEPPPSLNAELPLQVELLRYHQGVRVVGMGALGLFDPEGALHAAIMRLLPIPEGLEPDPALTEAQALARIEAETEALVVRDPQLHWLRSAAPLTSIERAVELVWHRQGLTTSAPFRLAYEVQLRRNVDRAYLLVDANTGEVLRAYDTTPSDWHDEGMAVTATALDTSGAEQMIPSTRFEGDLWMGLGTSAGTGLFTAGHLIAVSDSGGRDDPSPIYFDPMRESVATDGWTLTEPERAATGLLLNAMTALRWWQDRDWRSWNGRGGSLWTGININRNDDGSPSLNAWGGGGGIAIGDGSSFGRTLTTGDSLEVVGHELMHSVIDATSRLEYLDESGAANEALADFFGAVLTGVGDDFSDETLGEAVFVAPRNIVRPSASGDPDTYSDLRRLDWDAGGVHSNSGILNRAHALVVRGGSHGGHSVSGVGLARAERILRLANRAPAFGRYATLEEVAVGVVSFCDLLTHLLERSSDPGAAAQRQTCDAFFQAYRATELMPGRIEPDLAVESATVHRSFTDVTIRNVSSVPIDTARFEAEVIDELGESTPLLPWRIRVLPPGDGANFNLPVPDEAFLGATATTALRELRIRYVPSVEWPYADAWLGNNEVTVRVGSDYTAETTVVADLRPGEDRMTLRTTVRNEAETLGTFAGLTAVYLERSAASGPFTVVATAPAEVALSETRFGDGTGVEELPEASIVVAAGAPSPVPATFEVPTLPRRYDAPYQLWLDDQAGSPSFEGHRQLYVLIDALDGADEMDETNNLVCINCRGPGAGPDRGVVVRLPPTADVSSLFPVRYRAAAAKLRSPSPLLAELREHPVATLPYRLTPALP